MGMTIAEKIIARAAGVESVRPGDIHTVEVDRLMSNDGTTHLTIDMYNTGQSKGSQESYNMNYQKLGKDMPYLLMKSSVALNFTRTGTRSTGF